MHERITRRLCNEAAELAARSRSRGTDAGELKELELCIPDTFTPSRCRRASAPPAGQAQSVGSPLRLSAVALPTAMSPPSSPTSARPRPLASASLDVGAAVGGTDKVAGGGARRQWTGKEWEKVSGEMSLQDLLFFLPPDS
ncbi:MAG: hypothetical protein ACPIOQ_46895 [Promethearchaeia archaeon]